jgi:hypothetical protein
MKPAGPPKWKTYLCLLAMQFSGAMVFVWQELPEFRLMLLFPGQQLPKDNWSDLSMVGVFLIMQIGFWTRLRHVPIPVRSANVFLSHVFLFLGRLSFIFGSALFAVVIFRHVPELGPETSTALLAQRGVIFVACLFALFCTSLEVERLGQAFEGRER